MAYLSDDLIYARLQEDYNFVESMGYVVFGVFLFGSQNYGVDYEDSDIDTRVIVFPKLDEIASNVTPISTTEYKHTSEHVDIKDLRLYIDQLLKPSFVHLENLYTKYRVINPNYSDIMSSMSDLCNDLADQNKLKIMLDIWGRKNMHEQYLKQGSSRIEKYGYDYKQVYHMVRLADFINRFSSGELFTDCALYSNPNYLVELERNPLPCKEAFEIAKDAALQIDQIYRANFDKLKSIEKDNTANELLRLLRAKAMKRYLCEVIV